MVDGRLIQPHEWLRGHSIALRLLTLDDCTEQYVGWLNDPDVNQYLETRWVPQTIESVRSFVADMQRRQDSYLFSIIENGTTRHIGNIKIGPIHPQHNYADVSYFIGERSCWGRGYATEAIRLVTHLGFDRLGLHRVQAGLYGSNVGSARALEKVGYRFEGRFDRQLRTSDGWEDHLWYGLVREDWRP